MLGKELGQAGGQTISYRTQERKLDLLHDRPRAKLQFLVTAESQLSSQPLYQLQKSSVGSQQMETLQGTIETRWSFPEELNC